MPLVFGIAMVIAARGVALGQQVKPVEPYYAVVTASGSAMHAGPKLKLHYRVTRFQAGQLLRVMGEADGVLRVEYPPEGVLGVFVAADFARLSDDGKSVILTKPARCKAVNAASGFRGSWWPVFDEPLPVGTTMTLYEKVESGKGGYRVAPPRDAKGVRATGYVAADAVRKATKAEVEAYLLRLKEQGKAGPDVKAEPEPEPEPAKPAAEPDEGLSLAEPQVEPGEAVTEPVQQPEPDEAEGQTPAQPATEQPETGPVILEQQPAPTPPPAQLTEVEALEIAFNAVRRQPIKEAELNELIAQFERVIAEQPETDAGVRMRARLGQRLELLRLRADLQARLQRIAEATRQADARRERVAARIATIAAKRPYNIIGRLVPSTVYNGKRLPLMYRVQSIGEVYPRTLGYLKPEADIALNKKVGLIVGIVGTTTLDEKLKLSIISPRRVDVLANVDRP